MKTKRNWLRGLTRTETRSLVIGAGTLIAGVLLGVSGIVDGDVAILIAGSALTLVSIFVTTSAFIKYQWAEFLDNMENYKAMGRVLMEDALAEAERKKHDTTP